MKKIYNMLIFIGWILTVGTVGGLEMNRIDFRRCILQLIGSLIVILLGAIGKRLLEIRRAEQVQYKLKKVC